MLRGGESDSSGHPQRGSGVLHSRGHWYDALAHHIFDEVSSAMTNGIPSPESDHTLPSELNTKKEYEGALGEFLVVFNKIENIIGDILVLALMKAGRHKIDKRITGHSFAQKVLYLDLISLHFSEAASAPLIIALKALGEERNHLAHGHFEENDFDESYVIVSENRRLEFPVAKIKRLTKQAETLYCQLRLSQAFFWFEDITKDSS